MSISRREFIVGTAAGLILPSYFNKIFAYYENTGEALLEAPKNTESVMIASSELGGGETYELNLGDPFQEPPQMTLREYVNRYCGGEQEWLDCNGCDDEFDRVMQFQDVVDEWLYHDGPNARAYRLLKGLDLGPKLSGAEAVGEIRFVNGGAPGIDYLGAHAPTQLDIALLQKRLNDLDMGILISIE